MENGNPVQDAVSAQLKFEVNGEELPKGELLILQQKYGVTPLSEDEVSWYLGILNGVEVSSGN